MTVENAYSDHANHLEVIIEAVDYFEKQAIHDISTITHLKNRFRKSFGHSIVKLIIDRKRHLWISRHLRLYTVLFDYTLANTSKEDGG